MFNFVRPFSKRLPLQSFYGPRRIYCLSCKNNRILLAVLSNNGTNCFPRSRANLNSSISSCTIRFLKVRASVQSGRLGNHPKRSARPKLSSAVPRGSSSSSNATGINLSARVSCKRPKRPTNASTLSARSIFWSRRCIQPQSS